MGDGKEADKRNVGLISSRAKLCREPECDEEPMKMGDVVPHRSGAPMTASVKGCR